MAETKIAQLNTPTSDAAAVDSIIGKLTVAKTMMNEPDKDGLRKDLVGTALKKSASELTQLLERYKKPRQSGNG